MKVLLRPGPDAAPDAELPLRVAADVVVRAAAFEPLIVRLDDVQWSKGEAALLVRAVARAAPASGVVFVATERADESDSSADYVAAMREVSAPAELVVVAMQPLDATATRAMIRGLLDLDDELATVVARRCEGNPLFASQLVAQLVRARAIVRRAGRYTLSKKVAGARGPVDIEREIPPDMRALWARRVALSGATPLHLMGLALVRERVSSEVVDALALAMGETWTESFTRALGSGLVVKEGDLYAFSHGLLRDYLLSEIAEKDRARLHGAAAAALAVLVGREDVEQARAEHLYVAGRFEEALSTMLEAAMWSWRRAEREPREKRTSRLIGWAERHTDVSGARALRARALAELAHCYAEGGRFELANPTLDRGLQSLATAEDDAGFAATSAWVKFREAQVVRLQGRVGDGARISEEARTLAQTSGELVVEALCCAQLGLDAFRRGDYPTASSRYDESIALLRRAKNRSSEAQVLMMKSALEEPTRMEALSRRAVEMAIEAGALRIELLARQVWIEALFRLGDRARASLETEVLSAAAQRRGLRQTVSMVEGVAACWAVLESDWDAAKKHADVCAAWGSRQGAAPERATIAALDLALALKDQNNVAMHDAMSVLLREGRTYREPHFQELIRRLLSLAPEDLKIRLLLLDAAQGDP
ncbi:MAG: hypothetical protein U0271_29755 [Polyangiaceae bacterium]